MIVCGTIHLYLKPFIQFEVYFHFYLPVYCSVIHTVVSEYIGSVETESVTQALSVCIQLSVAAFHFKAQSKLPYSVTAHVYNHGLETIEATMTQLDLRLYRTD